MSARPDYNLLITLDALLKEGSVLGAANRLQLSPSAMSRSLARLRETTGDPLLVRTGRKLVPTPRAVELSQITAQLVDEIEAALSPRQDIDLKSVSRVFTLRSSDGFVETFGPKLIARLATEAPGVQLRFVQKEADNNRPLRDGDVDIETGVISENTDPNFQSQALLKDHFVYAMRPGHPCAASPLTTAQYVSCEHVDVARHADVDNQRRGPINAALAGLGHQSRVKVVVGGFAAALSLARCTDLVATVPAHHTRNLRRDLCSHALPFAVPGITVSMLWHPRFDADPLHRWMRATLREICAQTTQEAPGRSPDMTSDAAVKCR
ncbi:LysR family transcriptional regulator [Epibacterium sp. Ofav1-8]|uniref:LysR family transcriptional regulator n=1 Tax=Epibacterium sp. Ofav1-8 TaxID=2917735 RepID=UPI001EF46D83|nr:LysR family transcriptional regulator [Epibacterium sp. Ofav1-8]